MGICRDPEAQELLIRRSEEAILSVIGEKPLRQSASTDCNIPFSMGIPAVCFGLVSAGGAHTREEWVDLDSLSDGLKIALRLADKAREKGNFELAEITERVPFNPPKTFHEGLCAMGFMRKALGTIEGYGFSSMGRADVLLKDLYEKDKANGVSEEEMLDLVSRFLIFFDATNDRREKFDGVVSYELENTLTLGGCDENGEPVYNGVTKLFIDARDTLNCTYPKFMCRFSENSPEEYLRLISRSLTKGQSYSIYENDDTMIPALLRCGTELKDARNYIVGGCWDALTPDYNNKYSGECFFLVHPLLWLMKKCKP
jgi:pyruvate-formate lyase